MAMNAAQESFRYPTENFPMYIYILDMAGSIDLHLYKFLVIVTLLVLVLFNPYTFKLVHSLLKSFVKIASGEGCPTTSGLLVHGLVFLVLLKVFLSMGVRP